MLRFISRGIALTSKLQSLYHVNCLFVLRYLIYLLSKGNIPQMSKCSHSASKCPSLLFPARTAAPLIWRIHVVGPVFNSFHFAAKADGKKAFRYTCRISLRNPHTQRDALFFPSVVWERAFYCTNGSFPKNYYP